MAAVDSSLFWLKKNYHNYYYVFSIVCLLWLECLMQKLEAVRLAICIRSYCCHFAISSVAFCRLKGWRQHDWPLTSGLTVARMPLVMLASCTLDKVWWKHRRHEDRPFASGLTVAIMASAVWLPVHSKRLGGKARGSKTGPSCQILLYAKTAVWLYMNLTGAWQKNVVNRDDCHSQ